MTIALHFFIWLHIMLMRLEQMVISWEWNQVIDSVSTLSIPITWYVMIC